MAATTTTAATFVSDHSESALGLTPLMAAVLAGDLARVEKLIEEKADVNASTKKEKNMTALACAVTRGIALAERLVQAGADVKATSLVASAAECGSIAMCEWLIAKGADPNLKDNDCTPLWYAASVGRLEVCQLLLQNRADPNIACGPFGDWTALSVAQQNRHADVVALLKPLTREPQSALPLIDAAKKGDVKSVTDLLSQAPDSVDTTDRKGSTALCEAAFAGQKAVCEALLLRKANPNHVTKSGHTPLWIAAAEGHLQIVELLFKHGADVEFGMSPVYGAAENGELAAMELLLEHKGDPNAKVKGWTALGAAAEEGFENVVKSLLQHNADPTATNGNSGTAARIAASKWKWNIVALLNPLMPVRYCVCAACVFLILVKEDQRVEFNDVFSLRPIASILADAGISLTPAASASAPVSASPLTASVSAPASAPSATASTDSHNPFLALGLGSATSAVPESGQIDFGSLFGGFGSGTTSGFAGFSTGSSFSFGSFFTQSGAASTQSEAARDAPASVSPTESQSSSAAAADPRKSVEPERIKFNVALVGDSGVGKSAFVRRHQTGEFVKTYTATDGVDVQDLAFYTNMGSVTLRFWDVGGKELGSALSDGYFISADAAIIMFDVTSKATYAGVSKWYDKIQRICDSIPIVLAGNKVDCKERAVKPKDITFHREKNLQYYDISSKSNYNFEKPLLYLLRRLTKQPDLMFVEAPALVPAQVVIDWSTVVGPGAFLSEDDL